jgi:hypothetical protein
MSERTDPSGAQPPEDASSENAGLSVDEQFARLVAEVDGSRVQGPGAKEEAARTRELRAKWSKNPPQAVPWRADGPKPWETPGPAPAATPASPAPQDPWAPRPKTGRERAKTSVKVLITLAVVGLVGYAALWPHHHPAAPLNASPAGTDAPWSAAASASASPSPTFTSPDDAHFADSPALGWADNEAGFVLPEAAALNGVSRSDVAAGYQLAEKVMAAGNLDATVLDGGPTRDFTNLIDPSNGVLKDLASWTAHPSYRDDPTLLVTRFNPASTRLLGHTVKVHGTMSAKAGPHHGTVLVTADYVFVYAVGPVSGSASEDTRVSVHRTMRFEVVNPADYEAVAGKAWIDEYAVSSSNIRCYEYDGYIEPGFDGAGGAPNATGTADPYATGNLLTAPAQPSSTSTVGLCQAADAY